MMDTPSHQYPSSFGLASCRRRNSMRSPRTEQAEVERTTADLCLRYGEDFMRRDRERHRYELFLAGYDIEP